MLAMPVVLALLATQTLPEARGAVLALTRAGEQIASRTVTYPSGAHMACVAPESAIPGAAVTLRIGVALLSRQTQVALGAAPLLDGEGAEREWVYGALEVQAAPDAGLGLPPLPSWIRILETGEVEKRAGPLFPACEVAIVREGYLPSPWRCACRGAGACTWTPPLVGGGFGAAVSLPKALTAPPGTWAGAGCVPKVCVEYAASTSMPAACQ
jgi:hypothetical protein